MRKLRTVKEVLLDEYSDYLDTLTQDELHMLKTSGYFELRA